MTAPDRAVARRAWLPVVAVTVVVALALALRVLGAGSGLPFTYDPDEPDFVDRAFRMLATGDMNPRWFGHPGTVTMYSFWLTFAAYAATAGGTLAELSAQFRADPSAFYWLARGVMVACGGATVALTWLVARPVAGPWPALAAAGLLAVAPQHVEFSRYARPDVQVTLLALAALWCAQSVATRGRWRDYLAAGVLLGLAVVTKYPALVFALAIVLAHFLRVGAARLPWWSGLERLAAAGAATLVGAFAGSPWLFLSLPTAFADIAREARSYHLGATSLGFLDSLWWYCSGPLLAEVGAAGLALAALGALVVLRRRDPAGLPMLAAALLFMLFIAALNLRWARWVLPAVPPLCVLSAIGLREAAAAAARILPRRAAHGAAAVLALVTVALPASVSIAWTQAAARGDTRDAAWDWIMEHVPAGSAILLESYTPQLPPERYRLYAVSDGQIWRLESAGRRYAVPRGVIGALADVAAVRRAGIDYVVIANHYDRRLPERERYGREIGVYEEIMAGGERVFEALPGPRRAVGVPVRVYRMRR